jgi:hypothetical protein
VEAGLRDRMNAVRNAAGPRVLGGTVVEITTDANTNNDLGASLEDIRRTPLDRLASDQVDNVVLRIVDDETEAVGVAAFSSSI